MIFDSLGEKKGKQENDFFFFKINDGVNGIKENKKNYFLVFKMMMESMKRQPMERTGFLFMMK